MPFNAHHRKNCLLLTLAVVAAFGLCLSNGFVGDDIFLFINNNFYHSWANFPHLWSQHYLTDSDKVISGVSWDLGSGSVAYRPVLSATYFFDFWLWRLNPAGYHLHNLVLHLVNVLMVYVLLSFLMGEIGLAFLAALLFAIHPLTAEPVCAIGYRADLLATGFALAAFLAYLRFREGPRSRKGLWFFASHLFYFLGVFAKESVIVLPGILFLYDQLLRTEKSPEGVIQRAGRYAGFLAVMAFYLFVYFRVFPNRTIAGNHLFGGRIFAHILTVALIFCQYGLAIIFPGAVKSLPPLHLPGAGWPVGLKASVALPGLAFFCYLAVKMARHSRLSRFFVLWFLLAFLPVANIIPLANPMAYRFVYFPLVAGVALLAIFLMRILPSSGLVRGNRQIPRILQYGFLIFSFVMTVLLCRSWKNPYTMAAQMYFDFPQDPIACLLFAAEKKAVGKIDDARRLLDRGFRNGLDDPRAYYLRGQIEFEDRELAKKFFLVGLQHFPKIPSNYLAAGRAFLLEGDYQQAGHYLEEYLDLAPRSYKGYAYLLQSYALSGQESQAQELMSKAQEEIPDAEALRSLRELFAAGKNSGRPLDLGY